MRFALFGCIWGRLVAYETLCETGQTSGFVGKNLKLTFWCISYYLGAFGAIWLPYETRSKTGLTSAKVHAMKSRRNFHKERTRSTPLDPKLTFWCVSYYLGAFGTVWLPYGTRCKTGQTSLTVRATKSRRNFSQRMHPIHPIGP